MIPLPDLKNKNEDVIFKMSFNATNHPKVQMYNKVRISTRALHLEGCDPTSQDEVGAWLNKIYQAYAKIRAIELGKEKEVSDGVLKSLMEQYCSLLRSTTPIIDYWVTLYDKNKLLLDSKEMNL